MEDYDWIQIAFIFDDDLSSGLYEPLLEIFLEQSSRDDENEEFEVSYQDGEGRNISSDAHIAEVGEIATTSKSLRISAPLGWDKISIGHDKNDKGLIDYSSTSYLRFTTWVYSLEDPKKEPLEKVKRRRRELVEILAEAADVLEPQWGFGRRGGLAIGEDEAVEELASMMTPPLYEYNVFRSETVEELGRERVLSAPAWYTEELDSGGVFMAVREPPRQCAPNTEKCLEVANHLGIPLGKTERYH